ncbi:MAG TPA: LytTR family DNA-binding domain-containing protein [Bacteroidia bacterium]|nr:LytTR family DNA-binding domain-containing protein [Bacteroidia bacterium]
MYTTLIVDDEKPQQDLLSGMIKDHFPDLQLVGICSSVDEGTEKIKAVKPQLIFLDVVMPPFTGFDLLNRLSPINFDVIFTTSYEQYAIKAFKVSAVDYLLKPFTVEQLAEGIGKFEKKIQLKQSLLHIETLLHNIDSNSFESVKIALPTLNGFTFIQLGEIIRCESDNTYTTFFLANKTKMMVSKTMKECEDILSDYNFFRIHNSHLINMHYIKDYVKGEGGQVRMSDNSLVDVSRKRKQEFLNKLHRI